MNFSFDRDISQFNLETLFNGKLTTDVFIASNWPKSLLVLDHGPAWLKSLGGLERIIETNNLFELWTGKVFVFPQDEKAQISGLALDATTARRLYRAGMGVAFEPVEARIAPLRNWLHRIAHDIGLPIDRLSSKCLAYASPKGAGVCAHFDANVNFIIQIRGKKRWKIAPNEHVVNPTIRHDLVGKGMPGELTQYAKLPLPDTMPANAETIDMTPGKVLFLPRGVWHATETLEDSISFNFMFSQPTWADITLHHLRTKLISVEDWRELALDTGTSHKDRRSSAERRLNALLGALNEVVRALTATDILDAWNPRYKVSEALSSTMATTSDSQSGAKAPGDVEPILSWLLTHKDPFNLSELRYSSPQAGASGAEGLLQSLLRNGLVEKA